MEGTQLKAISFVWLTLCVSLPLILSFMILELIKVTGVEGPPPKKHKAGQHDCFLIDIYIYVKDNICYSF